MKERIYFLIQVSNDKEKWIVAMGGKSKYSLNTVEKAIDYLDVRQESDLRERYKYFRIVKCIERTEESVFFEDFEQ